MFEFGHFADRIIAQRSLPGREARHGELPPGHRPEIALALRELGIPALFSHQAEFYRRALDGEDLVITTGTASGKSLAYLLPVLQAVLEDPAARALLLFPTKALAQDQLLGLLEILSRLGRKDLQAGVYDGDTPPVERSRIREKCHLVLTNPDMLNASWMPNHGRRGFTHLFKNLRYVVVDEMHGYRGAFGSHVANLFRRLRRLTRHYGSNPRILASSATIANPTELAERLFDRPFGLVSEDGSPSAGRTISFWQPPVVEGDLRRSVVQEMADFLPHLVARGRRSIAFCRSRKETEVVLKECRDHLSSVDGGHDDSRLVAGYRGGYTPEERRQVERDLKDGRLVAVVSTNALELGVDIGGLEVVLQAGFPGTRASFWQQIGRAGRRGRESQAVVMLRMTPIDQFIAMDPDWLIRRGAEHAVIDRDNLMIQLAHLRAAAAELPLTLDDVRLFPDLGEAAAVLAEAGELRSVHGSWHWCGGAHPAGDFSLRNIDRDRFKIVNVETGMTISEMDRPQTYHEAHLRAVYLHDGIQHLVEDLDLVGHVVKVRPVEQNYYTEPDVRVSIEVLGVQKARTIFESRAWFGDVRVEDATIGYKMLQFHNHQNLGYEMLPERLVTTLETEAAWFSIPAEVMRVLAAEEADHLRGVLHAVLACGRMLSMAEGQDLRGTTFHHVDEGDGSVSTCVILYDGHPGGLGFSQKVEEGLDRLLEDALHLLQRCPCRAGCPACVGDWQLEKELVVWALRCVFEVCPPPAGRQARPGPPQVVLERRFELADLPTRWAEFCAGIADRGVPGAEFLRKVPSPRIRGPVLILEVDSPALKDWVEKDDSGRQLRHLIAHHAKVPPDFRVEARVSAEAVERAHAKTRKLRRRHDDLMGRGEDEETGASPST